MLVVAPVLEYSQCQRLANGTACRSMTKPMDANRAIEFLYALHNHSYYPWATMSI